MMFKLISVIYFCMQLGLSRADYCEDNPDPPLDENIILELAGIVLTGTVNFKGCFIFDPVVDADVKFLLYTPDNLDNPIILDHNNPVELDPLKPIKIFIHGWAASVCNSNVSTIAQIYLERYDCNVIGIDWSAISISEYSSAYCAVPGVATIISKFLCNLSETFQVDLTEQIHAIGHSLGAQILGYTGQEVQETCNSNINRISGLDPAGPLFIGQSASNRLDPTDANFVDVIHTNGGGAGYSLNCGHVDFYPNCGTLQNGCEEFSSIEEAITLPVTVITCSHIRSIYYWVESITPTNKKFVSTSCKGCVGVPTLPYLCPKDMLNPKYAVMGEDCPRNPPATRFYVLTNDEYPFARG